MIGMYGVIKTYRALIAKISTYGKMTRDKRNRLGEELTMYKKEDVEKHEKRGFKRPSRRLCSSPRTLT